MVNGLTGKVVKINEDNVEIVMDDDKNLMHNFGGKKFRIDKYAFHIYDEHNNLVGTRIQLPIKLGYSITVDKAQGRTLDAVVVDCYNFWRCSQLGVAIGRAIEKETLQVQNFNSYVATLQHPKCVKEFYMEKGQPMKMDLSCCKQEIDAVPELSSSSVTYTLSYSECASNYPSCSTNDDHTIHHDTSHLAGNGSEINLPINYEDFISGELFDPVTPIQENRNRILLTASKNVDFKKFISTIYTYLNGLILTYRI